MLLITKGESKFWYLTLTEKVTISNPYFLFNLKNRVTEVETNVIITDVSAYTERYNKFAVSEGTTFSADAGEYEYKIYAQTSSVNLDPLLANELVEEGIFKLMLGNIATTEYQVELNEKIYEVESPESIYRILLENGDFLLLENNDKILI